MAPIFQKPAILEKTFLRHVEIFDCLGSTQDRALELCGDLSHTHPALIVAERQTAGRGRDGASWWSPEGALLFSLIVPLPKKYSQPQSSGLLSLAVAQAVADYLEEALRPSANDHAVRVKPPNDIYVADAKIAGLLIDVPHQPDRARRLAILGVGLNVNNDCSNCPEDIAGRAASLYELSGHKLDLQETLLTLLGHIEGILVNDQ